MRYHGDQVLGNIKIKIVIILLAFFYSTSMAPQKLNSPNIFAFCFLLLAFCFLLFVYLLFVYLLFVYLLFAYLPICLFTSHYSPSKAPFISSNAQAAIALIIGCKACPELVNRYVTKGGTTGLASRMISLSASSCFKC